MDNQTYISELSEKRITLLSQEIQAYHASTEGLRRIFTEFVIGNLPDTDLNMTLETLKDCVEHSAWLYEQNVWGHIPDDIFLNFVVHPRCSKEKLEPCRRFFYDEVKSLITPDITRTVLDINYWCASHVKYQLTDPRTKSALFSFISGSGRCGEKSTFLVQVFRSVGIPARNAYVPFWEHIDDNHAWVEVYIDGTWRYIGAGEGEEHLEKAWFTLATTRAPYVLSNASTFLSDSLEVFQRDKLWKSIDHTSHYRKTKQIHVTTFLDIKTMDVCILNYSSFRPINSIHFKHGEASFSYGGGDVFLKAYYKDALVLKRIETHENKVSITDDDIVDEHRSFEQIPAPVGEIKVFHETDAMIESKESRRHQSQQAYLNKMERINQEGLHHEAVTTLNALIGNDAASLLNVMKPKDILDFDPTLYATHFKAVLPFRKEMDETLFMNYVATPRVYWEELTESTETFQTLFSAKASFKENPSEIYRWAKQTIKSDSIYAIPNTYMPINRMIEYPYGTAMDVNILVVSIARSLGIPARYNEEKDDIEYHNGCCFVSFKDEKKRYTLTLHGNLSALCISINSTPTPAAYSETTIDNTNDTFSAAYNEGIYEVIASKRMPSGKIVGTIHVVNLDQDQTVEIKDIAVDLDDIVENIPIMDCLPRESISENGILIVGDPLEEPTAHALNELLEQKDVLEQGDIPVYFVNKNPKADAPLLNRALTNIKTCLLVDTLTQHQEEVLARRVFREPKSYPLVIVMKDGLSMMSTSGYQVNSINNPWVRQIFLDQKLAGIKPNTKQCVIK